MNRITTAIDKTNAQIKTRLDGGIIQQADVDRLNKTLNLDVGEHAMFQTLKSFAFASGKLNLEEAQALYQLLGPSANEFNSRPVAVKSVLTKVFAELLAIRQAA